MIRDNEGLKACRNAISGCYKAIRRFDERSRRSPIIVNAALEREREREQKVLEMVIIIIDDRR